MAKRFKIVCVLGTSRRFGPCEVCGQDVSDVHMMVEDESYEINGRSGWLSVDHRFGHETCMADLAKQRAA
jgi:hypothetical protein